MSQSARRRLFVALFVCGALLAGFSYPSISKSISDRVGWRRLGLPLDSAMGFLGYTHDEKANEILYVLTRGAIYACYTRVQDYFWFLTQACSPAAYHPDGTSRACDSSNPVLAPTPPGKVVYRRVDHPCELEADVLVDQVVLEDGTAWVYIDYRSDYWDDMMLLCASPLLGLAAAVTATLAIACINRSRRTMS